MIFIRRLLCLILTLLLILVPVSVSAATVSDFRDISKNAWYYNAVNYTVKEGILTGTGTNTFSPNTKMTRGMFITMVGKKMLVDIESYKGATKFSDVSASAYYAPYIKWATQKGIVSGVSSTRFAPDQYITREEMAVMLYNYAKKFGKVNNASSSGLLDSYEDEDELSRWAKTAVNWAVNNKILSGKSRTDLAPKDLASRAEAAQMMYNGQNVLPKYTVLASYTVKATHYCSGWCCGGPYNCRSGYLKEGDCAASSSFLPYGTRIRLTYTASDGKNYQRILTVKDTGVGSGVVDVYIGNNHGTAINIGVGYNAKCEVLSWG